MLQIKRIYEPRSPDDGYRILIDRLWPRGVSRTSAAVDLWLKDVAPSAGLRKWFNHAPGKWEAFRRRYEDELEENSALVEQLKSIGRDQGMVTLLYAARDEQRNQAVVLRDFASR